MRALALVALVAGCGRVGFARMGDGGEPSVDTPPAPTVCGARATAPDPIAITGSTFRYTSYTNDRMPLGAIAVTARARATGAVLASATSLADGTYTLALPTGGAATPIVLEYTGGGVLLSRVIPDVAVDRDATATGDVLFRVGDGPLWNAGQMQQIYGLANAPIDSATVVSLNISVVDCAGAAIPGATIAIDPPPEKLVYLSAGGMPDESVAVTAAPYAVGLACNAVPGPTHITATAPGYTFADQVVDIGTGPLNSLVLVRPVDP